MHELATLIQDLAVILGVASLVTLIFQKIRQPVVLGYLLAGAIVGPYTPPHALVSDIPYIKILSDLGVIFLMFSLGLEFSFHKLKRVGFSASITGLIEVLLMTLLGYAVGRMLNWDSFSSLFLGAAMSISSTTIIIKALEGLCLKTKRFSEVIFGILIVEDLLAIVLLVALSTMAATQNFFSLELLLAALKLILVVGSWFILGYFLVPPLFRLVMKDANDETLIIVSIALCLFLVNIAAYFHYSIALGAFIMGSILAETISGTQISKLIKPVRDIFAAVFFVSIGMLIDLKMIWEHFPLIIFLCMATIIGKVMFTGVGAFLTGQSFTTSLRIGFSMAQIGEFSFIIVGLGQALKIIDDLVYPIVVAVSAITTFTTPYFIKLSGVLTDEYRYKATRQTKYFIDSYSSWVYRTLATHQQEPLYYSITIQLTINAVIVAILFTLTQEFLLPELEKWTTIAPMGKAIAWFCALIIASPFIWGMLVAFQSLPSKKTKHLAPRGLYVCGLITLTEIAILSVAFYDNWLTASLLAIAVFCYFGFLYKHLDKSYHWFEKRLLQNLKSPKTLYRKFSELAPWDSHLVEIVISPNSTLVGASLNQIQLRKEFGLNIAALCRGDTIIAPPRGHQIIYPFDKLFMVGNDEQLERFSKKFIKAPKEISSKDLLNEFSLRSMYLESGSPLIGKTIKKSGLLEMQILIVGLERDNHRILNPVSNTLLKKGDLLFILGKENHHQHLENLP